MVPSMPPPMYMLIPKLFVRVDIGHQEDQAVGTLPHIAAPGCRPSISGACSEGAIRETATEGTCKQGEA
jgi:hypothetical protein